jgi:ketosteroid isomerase-like protein
MSQAETEKIVRAYHDAYRRGDVNAAGAQLAESFKFSSPMMAFDSPQQHLAALVRFVPFITGIHMISELYSDGEATLVYDLHTSLPGGAAVQRCAEHFRVADDRISSIIIIFDATPWRPIIQAAADMRGPLEVAGEGGQD